MPHGPAPHGPASDTSPEIDAIHAAYPALNWERATRTEEGWDHVVILCHSCSGDDALGHTDLVFRFPTDEQAHAQLPTEIAVLDHLAGNVEASIPRYTHVPDGLPFAGYPMVRGERLTPELLHSLPFTEQTTVAAQLGALLAALHIQDIATPPMNLVPHSYQPENLDFVRGIVENNLPDVFTPDEMRTAREICDEVAALQSTLLPRAFLHYDIYARHLYWERGSDGRDGNDPAAGGGTATGGEGRATGGEGRATGRLGLIDFTDMCLGDPAIDFAELYEYGPRFVEDVLARYVGPVDATFLDRAWTYQRLAGLYTLAGHLYYGEETWEYARATFDRCRSRQRPYS